MRKLSVIAVLNHVLPTILLVDHGSTGPEPKLYELSFGTASSRRSMTCDLSFREKGGKYQTILGGIPFMTFHGTVPGGDAQRPVFLVIHEGKECFLKVMVYDVGLVSVLLDETANGWFGALAPRTQLFREDGVALFPNDA